MTRKEQVAICRKCLNREMNTQKGILCGLTHQKATFENECHDFNIDDTVADRPPIEEYEEESFFAPERKGLKAGAKGGLIMMAIALVWFVVGLEAGYMFYYPPILFIIGAYGFFKGLITGNLTGSKSNV